MSSALVRPPLAKVRQPALARDRSITLVIGVDGRLREIFDGADVVSEGESRAEVAGGVVYYGSTHLLLAPVSAGGRVADADVAVLARIASVDPHVRVRALRVARREAISRAGATLGPSLAEIHVETSPRGVVVHVDLMASVVGARADAR